MKAAQVYVYLTSRSAIVQRLASGSAEAYRFTSDEAGQQAFFAFIRQHPLDHVSLVIDLLEEDLRLDNVPYVMGRDRAAMLERKLDQLYRVSPFRNATVLGRNAEGRRDLRVLFSALTAPDLLAPWLDGLNALRIPVRAVHSLPVLTGRLLKRLHIPSEQILLVTLDHARGYRQTYFNRGEIRFSRFVSSAQESEAELAREIAGETLNTKTFLNNQRVLPRDQTLDIIILSQGSMLEALEAACGSPPMVRYAPLDLAEAAKRARLPLPEPAPHCEPLIFSLLAASRPPNHYAPARATHDFDLWRLRNGLFMLAGGILLAALGIAASGLLSGLSLSEQAAEQEHITRQNLSQVEELARQLPAAGIPLDDMKQLARVSQLITDRSADSQALLTKLSAVLGRHPNIHLDKLAWEQTTDRKKALAESKDPAAPPPAETTATGGNPGETNPEPPRQHDQVVTIEGQVVPFLYNYRFALEAVERLAADLGRQPGAEVRIQALPLNVQSQAMLKGQTGKREEDAAARFRIRMVLPLK